MTRKGPEILNGRTIRCLLFDFGDTLWTRAEALWDRAEQASDQRTMEVLHSILGTRPGHTLPTLTGHTIRKAVENQIRQSIRQNPGYEPDFTGVTREALQQLGLPPLSNSNAQEIFEALRVRIPDSRMLFPDTLSTLQTLQQRGFLLGVVTNRHYGGQLFQEDLAQLGLLHYFTPATMAISADLGLRKPHPDIFLHTLNALQVTPAEAAMVCDSLRADVAGAKNLGIFAVWKPKLSLRKKALKTQSDQATPSLERQLVATSLADPATMGEDDLDPREYGDDALISDTYLLKYAREHDKHWDTHLRNDLTPDLTITHLEELLDVFHKAGPS